MSEENKQKSWPSVNYVFCHKALPSLFFQYHKPFLDYLANKKESLNNEIGFLLMMLQKQGYDIKDFASDIAYRPVVDQQKGIAGIIFKLKDPKHETECNFVCLTFTEEGCSYYTSELFEASPFDKEHFELCGWNGERHSVYHTDIEDIRTMEDMWKAVISIAAKK